MRRENVRLRFTVRSSPEPENDDAATLSVHWLFCKVPELPEVSVSHPGAACVVRERDLVRCTPIDDPAGSGLSQRSGDVDGYGLNICESIAIRTALKLNTLLNPAPRAGSNRHHRRGNVRFQGDSAAAAAGVVTCKVLLAPE